MRQYNDGPLLPALYTPVYTLYIQQYHQKTSCLMESSRGNNPGTELLVTHRTCQSNRPLPWQLTTEHIAHLLSKQWEGGASGGSGVSVHSLHLCLLYSLPLPPSLPPSHTPPFQEMTLYLTTLSRAPLISLST